MKVFFLSADTPIQKRYELDQAGNLVKHPYPFVYDVTSHELEVNTLEELLAAIRHHSSHGNCLLKGVLQRGLVHESRAGSTDRNTPTEWLCLDLDGVEGFQSTDHFLSSIGLGDTDYIRQWSSSQGVEGRSGYRCHLFLLLNKPTHPQLIKQWLMQTNLTNPIITPQLELTKTGNSLRWPLDVSTCQNDKLIYIAPPAFGLGLTDPFDPASRIELVKGKQRYAVLPPGQPSHDQLRADCHAHVNAARKRAGLKERKKTAFKFQGPVEYFVNPDRATITDIKVERGFVYFNLNGGDSWAYYHPENNPTFIHNFKGEPIYRTEDLLPEYWAELSRRAACYQPNSQGKIYLAFRDFRSGNYYNGTYDSATGQLNFAQAKNETQLRHFMKQHGQPLGDFIPDWNIVFDPHTPFVVDPETRKVNIFEPSALMKEPPKPGVRVVPPTIHKVIWHVVGEDVATYEHFLNWLAVAVQRLTITGTAWVLHGTQGTGKGILFHRILSPLFGEWNVVSKRMEEIESEFTGFMENKFIAFIDEMESGKTLYHDKVSAKLKNLITEPRISIRKMYQPAFEATNFANLIFASNKPKIVEIAPDDRRFNVGAYQEKRLQITDKEIYDDIPAELPDFYSYLMAHLADVTRARTPLQSKARTQMIDISTPSVDVVSQALLAGNVEFFWDHLKDRKPVNTHLTLSTAEGRAYAEYRELIVEIVTHLPKALSREELRILYEWTVGNMPDRPNKFTSLLKHHRVHMASVYHGGRTVRGLVTTWNLDPAARTEMLRAVSADEV